MISSSLTGVNTPTFVTIQKDQDNADFTSWDGITKFQNAPSKSAHKMVSVLGDHYKYKFTKEELFKLTSKTNAIKSASLVKGDSNESALQSHLIIEPSSNNLRFNIDSCTVTINFDQPVLQTGEDEYRVYTDCACCGVCLCGSATPINPPSDPNFTKKLTGNDPNIAPFTQVSINYSITVTLPGSPPTSRTASGTMNGSWVDAIVPDPEGEYRCADYIGGPYTDPSSYLEINRVFQGNNCSFDDFCLGNCGRNRETPQRGIGSVYLRLRSDGCLIAILSEQYLGGNFYISKECPDRTLANAGVSISINGVSTYIVYEDPAGPNDTLAGFLNITFS